MALGKHNAFEKRTAFLGNAWMIQETLNPMISQGLMDSLVIAAPYNTGADRCDEYTYSYAEDEECGGKGDLYLDFIESTIFSIPVPSIDSIKLHGTTSSHVYTGLVVNSFVFQFFQTVE